MNAFDFSHKQRGNLSGISAIGASTTRLNEAVDMLLGYLLAGTSTLSTHPAQASLPQSEERVSPSEADRAGGGSSKESKSARRRRRPRPDLSS
jgi:hypothetical protein